MRGASVRPGGLPALYLLVYLLYLLGFHGGSAADPCQSRRFLPFLLILLAAGATLAGRPCRAASPEDASLWAHPMAKEFAALRPRVEASSSATLFVYSYPGQIAASHRAAVDPSRFWREAPATRSCGQPWLRVREFPGLSPPSRPTDWADSRYARAPLHLDDARSICSIRIGS